jgi:ferredoxin
VSGPTFLVAFPGSSYPPRRLPAGRHLSEVLDSATSPLLFGCRTGVCGTCAVRVTPLSAGRLGPPAEDEAELLALFHPGRSDTRLACQLDLSADVGLTPVGSLADP